MVISITLVFSTCPPVSVLVRARVSSLGAFLGGMASETRRLTASWHRASGYAVPDLPKTTLHAYPRATIAWAPLAVLVPHRSNGHDVVQEYQPVGHRLRLSASP